MSRRLPRSSARTTGRFRGSKPESWFLVTSATYPVICSSILYDILYTSFIPVEFSVVSYFIFLLEQLLSAASLNQGHVEDFSLGGPTPKSRKPRAGWGSWEGAATPSPPTRSIGERCEFPSGVRGAPTAQRFSTIFITQDGLSWHYNIVDYHAAIGGGARPRPPPLAYAPALNMHSQNFANFFCSPPKRCEEQNIAYSQK